MTLPELEILLEAFGGSPRRWPAGRRQAAERLIARDSDARRALAEAVAVDRLLSCASEPDPRRLADLGDRIVAAAVTSSTQPADGTVVRPAAPTSGAGARGANVIRLPVRSASSPSLPAMAQANAKASNSNATYAKTPGRFAGWQSAAALVASLMIGIAIGTTDFGSSTALGLAAVADAQAGDADIVLASLQGDGISTVLDEDQR